MRSFFQHPAALLVFGSMLACGLGVDMDGIFDGEADAGAANVDASDSGSSNVDAEVDASTVPDGGDVSVEELGVGGYHACVRRSDGQVACWGKFDNGRLGTGATRASSTPAFVEGIADATALGVGENSACVARADGSAYCWGLNWAYQLGNGLVSDAFVPSKVVDVSNAKSISVGTEGACVLTSDGTVKCWGRNTNGYVGDGTTTPHPTAVDVPGLSGVTRIASGRSTVCAVTNVGEVYCWGDNQKGQAGQTGTTSVLVPTKVPSLSGVRSIGGGCIADHFCAVLDTGRAKCWGDASAGALGDGSRYTTIPTPVDVAGLDDIVAIRASAANSCAVRSNGEVACWGDNFFRAVGVGNSAALDATFTPARVLGVGGASDVAIGPGSACAVHDSGRHVSCWGTNHAGALGRATLASSAVPVTVATLPAATGIALGFRHACAAAVDGHLSCWGWNEFFELGTTTAAPATGTAIAIEGVTNVQKIAGGERHTCLLAVDGSITCAGAGADGQLGTGQRPYRQETFKPFLSDKAVHVRAGIDATCAVMTNGKVTCSGGQLGGGASPVTVKVTPGGADFTGAVEVDVGNVHACARTGSGNVYCWGRNDNGELGIPDPAFRPTITTPVSLGAQASKIATGAFFSCALLADGSVKCWGSGVASTAPDFGGQKATSITAGNLHACALMTDETIRCWGTGTRGQLGNGSFVAAAADVTVQGIANAKEITAKGDTTCARLADGAVQCWGSNDDGALGDGTVMTDGNAVRVSGY